MIGALKQPTSSNLTDDIEIAFLVDDAAVHVRQLMITEGRLRIRGFNQTLSEFLHGETVCPLILGDMERKE